jgi:hypothetical protein
MEYILVKNRQQVLLGPMLWKPRFIQLEINDHVSNGDKANPFTISLTETGYVDCGDGYELIPVTFESVSYDSVYQYLAGPFYTYQGNEAIGGYTVHNADIQLVKPALKQQAAAERRRKQALGTSILLGSEEVYVPTTDDELQKYVAALTSIGNGTISWKFGLKFIDLDAAAIQTVIDGIRNYVQSQFDWEKSIWESIDAASTIDQLKAIVIVDPVV